MQNCNKKKLLSITLSSKTSYSLKATNGNSAERFWEKKITLQIIIIAIMENFYLKEAVIRRS